MIDAMRFGSPAPKGAILREPRGCEAVPLFDPEISERWDREWLMYLGNESMYPHLVPSTELALAGTIAGKTARGVFYTELARNDAYGVRGALRAWCPGDLLAEKNVLEIGCGCGFFGKQIGLVCASYLGLDYSHLALTIARATSSSNCTFLHISDAGSLKSHAGKYDVMVGRHFFIHQNFESSVVLLRLAKYLLRRGGFVCADFYHRIPGQPGNSLAAKAPLDREYPSSGFHYRAEEVIELARTCGFDIKSHVLDQQEQRRFVIFQAISRDGSSITDYPCAIDGSTA